MLPGGFVYPREGGHPYGPSQPVVEKMKESAAQGGHSKAEKLPKPNRSIHTAPLFFTVYVQVLGLILGGKQKREGSHKGGSLEFWNWIDLLRIRRK